MGKSGALPRKRGEAADPPRRGLRGVRGRPVGVGSAESIELDTLIHHRMRLGIVSALAANESVTFNELKALLQTTDGNLSVHARKLEEAGYVLCSKRFEGRRPKTEYQLTASGRRALQRYLDHMESLIHATRDTMGR
ncbi:MAG: winged helix-turn-helix domain-containing protein [Gemmatimonadaceae bacterium]